MPDVDTVRSWQGATMVDRDGDQLGTIDAIYVDDQTGEPSWALVNTGLFGTRSSFVPIAQATARGDQVQVPYEQQLVKDAPNLDPDGHLSEQEEQELWRHYGLDYGTTAGDADRDVAGTGADDATSGPDITEAEHEVVLREEEVVVDKRAVPKERVRLDTETVTEERQVGEEVRKEQIEVDGDRDRLGDDQRP